MGGAGFNKSSTENPHLIPFLGELLDSSSLPAGILAIDSPIIARALMSASITSEHTSGDSEFLKDLSRWNTIFRLSIAAILLVGLCAVARGQSAQSSVEVYADAIKQSVIAQRIVAMEDYLTLSSGGSLKTDALEFLIWDHMRLGHQAQSLQHAQELLAIAPNNALAIAVLNQDPPQALGKNALEKRLAMLKSARIGLERLGKPEGMPAHNFDALPRQVA